MEKQKEFKINFGNTEVAISRTGGTVLSFKVDGENIFYPWHIRAEDKERGGMPLCVPYFGLTEFSDKKHGFLRTLDAYDVKRSSEDSIVFSFLKEAKHAYSWDFLYTLKYEVGDRVLKVELDFTRIEDCIHKPAPINIAFHPYFATNGESKVSVFNGNVPYGNFSDEAKTISLETSQTRIDIGNKIIFMSVRGFTTEKSKLVLWSDDREKYVCVEPVLQDKKLFNTSDGIFMNTDESKKFSLEVLVK